MDYLYTTCTICFICTCTICSYVLIQFVPIYLYCITCSNVLVQFVQICTLCSTVYSRYTNSTEVDHIVYILYIHICILYCKAALFPPDIYRHNLCQTKHYSLQQQGATSFTLYQTRGRIFSHSSLQPKKERERGGFSPCSPLCQSRQF